MYDGWPHASIYLCATVSSYWKWSDNGQDISWVDGPTITFLPEMTSVMHRLAADGLPPLGSVLLLLAACRNNWRDAPSRRGLLAGVLDAESSSSSRELLWEVCNGLDKVQALPADLRQSNAAKSELAAMIFADAPSRLNRDVSQSVLAALEGSWSGSAARPAQAVTLSYWLVRDLGALREGLRRVDADALRLRMQTGLETLPAPAKVEPPPLTGAAWLSWLEQQPEFATVARLAKRLLAVIHIPRNLHEPDDLPVGGVTDIAPRGPLDRLLLSELAHDDLTLAVRVAMNEALYYRRESPPKTPPRQRHLLLDAGLRSWGLPRVYGTAVALAMAAHPEKNIEVVAHRANGTALTPVVVNTAEGLREHLRALDYRLHPGEALPAFTELLDADGAGDAVVVTAAETLADPAFQRALEMERSGTLYLASVARDGRFELQQYSRAGRKTLSTAQLPIEEILQDRPSAAKLSDKSKMALPAIFGMKPFPLLLSARATLENSWHLQGWGVLSLARDGRLLRWTKKRSGAQQVATGLPNGRIHGVAVADHERSSACLVVGKLSPRGLHAIWINAQGEVVQRVPLLPQEEFQSVSVDRNYAFFISASSIEAVNLRTGRGVAGRLFSKIELVQGLYVAESIALKSTGGTTAWKWSRLTGSERTTDLTPVLASNLPAQILRVFDVAEIEGPVAVNAQGEIYRTATGATTRINLPPVMPHVTPIERVARDGRRFLFNCSRGKFVVHTATGVAQAAINPDDQLEPEIHDMVRERSSRRRFLGIGITTQGELALITMKRTVWKLIMPWLNFYADTTAIKFHWQSFAPLDHLEVQGFSLQRAEFPDGSEALLDSRGLLHLRSADQSVPECTIVLCEGESAGWCSDGRRWGSDYYRGDQPGTRAKTIAHEVLQRFVERAR